MRRKNSLTSLLSSSLLHFSGVGVNLKPINETLFSNSVNLRFECVHDIENNDNSIVRNNSSFEPPCGRNISLDSYISASKAICSNTIGTNNHSKYNITLKQREAIKSLAPDNSIIIKEADKGGGIVIMNTEFYKTKSS